MTYQQAVEQVREGKVMTRDEIMAKAYKDVCAVYNLVVINFKTIHMTHIRAYSTLFYYLSQMKRIPSHQIGEYFGVSQNRVITSSRNITKWRRRECPFV